ncbi:MAG: glutaminyl-peptide cyclotransferase [Bacteroidetes bacterium]|nr:glutaminyl-peptide cyclotransferase [Bacteroidota bacterium]MBS1757587.1 glutaminyl-peptide cyclotransferase [Bacteroidota bacterium]
MKKIFFPILFLAVLVACNNNNDNHNPVVAPVDYGIAAPTQISYNIIAVHPHDTSAYTQGLQLYNGKMYEGTGDFETSSLRITDYKTGKVEKKHMMGTAKIFGEGINIFKNKIYQLTWQSNVVYEYDLNNIDKPIKTFNWPYEGWGITNNGTNLIVSDGSANLYFVNPDDFKVINTLGVVDNNGPVDQLNELEYINGYVYANVYQTDFIVKIDPENGHVVGKMTLSNLLKPTDIVKDRTDVLNGIAYDSTSKTMFITGKRWPKLFELKLN